MRPIVRLNGLLACLSLSCAAGADQTSIEALKHLSLEELMTVKVTSVSKKQESLGSAAAAIVVLDGR